MARRKRTKSEIQASRRAAQKRYYVKCAEIHKNAPMKDCACGCGTRIKVIDKYGRQNRYASSHNSLRKYDDPTEHKRAWNHRNRAKLQAYKKVYYQRRKAQLIKLKNDACAGCGYMYDGKNAAAFDFHHRDPTKKKFRLSSGDVVNHAWKKILEEADKCDLLCAVCHRLLHSAAF